jgi:nucleoid-associated protein YejK
MTEWQEGYREGIRDVLRELFEWCSDQQTNGDNVPLDELVEFLEEIKSLKL